MDINIFKFHRDNGEHIIEENDNASEPVRKI